MSKAQAPSAWFCAVVRCRGGSWLAVGRVDNRPAAARLAARAYAESGAGGGPTQVRVLPCPEHGCGWPCPRLSAAA